jgi:multidrug efflux pump subunit AcrB
MRRVIHWFADNGVAANLLMLAVVASGLLTLWRIPREVFPEFDTGIITVGVPFPGAAPEEVEEGVVIRVEEAVQDLEGIEEIRSTSAENAGTVTLEAQDGADLQRLLNDVKSRVDAIDTFPDEAEEPVIQEVVVRRQVINVAVSGDVEERTLKKIGERVRDDVVTLPGITQADLVIARPYEVSIEVSERALRQYGLTFGEVAAAVRRSSLDLGGGEITTGGGEVLLRTEGQAYSGRDFERLPLLTLPDGTRLRIGDVAGVVDGFADTDQAARFDGEPAVMVQVFRVGDQNAIDVAETVKAYVEEERRRLPEGVRLTTWADQSRILKSRLDTLIRNGRAGFVLVFLVLALFLRLSLAGWVALGIPISFLGAMAVMPWFDVTINLISLFAFIVVLGIVVDDAIVVGENIYSEYESGKQGLEAAVDGALGVHVPVIFAVLTSIAAFTPLLAVGGNTGQIMRVIPTIVIATLAFSLLESLFVLPNHLSHLRHGRKQHGALRRRWQRLRTGVARGLDWMIDHLYRPTLRFALTWRYAVVALAVALLVAVAGVVAGGWVRFTFFPPVEADNVVALLTMPQGTPAEETGDALERIEAAAMELQREIEEENGEDVFRHLLTSIGDQPYRRESGGPMTGAGSAGHLGEINVELTPAEQRAVTSTGIADRWRAKVGAVAGAEELTFTSSLFSAGAPIYVQLSGADPERLERVAERLKGILAEYPGVQDIADTFREGKAEVEIDVTPEAEAAGLSLADVARQTRQAFYGEEAQRIQRGRNEVKVMVRFPEDERRSLGDLENLRFRAPDGVAVPFTTAARAELSRGPASIQRVDRRRVLAVTADVDPAEGNANEILADLRAGPLPELMADFPGVRYSLEGEQQEQRETLGGLVRGFGYALLAIYVLLAIPFRSYAQPLIVMSAIPFGFIGAVGGHLLMGLDLTILSMFGIVALTGVVVNDSLVMVDFINQRYREGVPLRKAIRGSGVARFRAIVMTSLTTFAGLAPLLTERSVQAKFLIPMAVSLAFGVLFATFITLILVPVGYFILEDVKAAMRRLLGMEAKDTEDEEEEAVPVRG